MLPWSMVRTPARSAALMPSAPCACAATKLPQRVASSTATASSASEYCCAPGRDALRHHRAGRQHLDEVGAVLEVRAHHLAHLVDAVGEVADDRHVHVDGELARVAGAAGGRHVVAGHLQPRPGHRALVDGVAQIDVDVRPGRPHVAARREAGHQRGPRVDGAVDGRASRRRGEQRRLPVGADLVGEMRVQVDEPGQHRGGAEVDHLVGRHARRPGRRVRSGRRGSARRRSEAARRRGRR